MKKVLACVVLASAFVIVLALCGCASTQSSAAYSSAGSSSTGVSSPASASAINSSGSNTSSGESDASKSGAGTSKGDDVVDIQIPSCLDARPSGLPSRLSGCWCDVFTDADSVGGELSLDFVTPSGTERMKLDDAFFEENNLYCIADGECTVAPSGGHDFTLRKSYIENGVLCYQVDKTSPPSGAMTTQAFVENCLFVAVPKSSHIEKVRCLNCDTEFDCVNGVGPLCLQF